MLLSESPRQSRDRDYCTRYHTVVAPYACIIRYGVYMVPGNTVHSTGMVVLVCSAVCVV